MFSVKEIISRIDAVYSSCSSYQDEGFAKLIIEDYDGQTCISRKKFNTLITPPRLFRFEFRDELFEHDKNNIVCINSEGSQSKVFDCDSTTSIRREIAKMHGISKGAVSQISVLIFDDLRDFLKPPALFRM